VLRTFSFACLAKSAPSITRLQEEVFMERIAGSVVARLQSRPNAQVPRRVATFAKRKRRHFPESESHARNLAEQRGNVQPTVQQGRRNGDVLRIYEEWADLT
jgi:hypothetical protein